MVGRIGHLVGGSILLGLSVVMIILLAIIPPGGYGFEDPMYWWLGLIFSIAIAFFGAVDIFEYFKKPETFDKLYMQKKKNYDDVEDVEPDGYMSTLGNKHDLKKVKKKTYNTVI